MSSDRDNDNDERPAKAALRERARAALAEGSGTLPESIRSADYTMAALVEDLRVYQAELEIQNEQLRETQGVAESAARRFATLFDAVPVAVMVFEAFGHISRCNPRATQLFRLEERHLHHNFLLRLVGRGDADRVTSILERLFAGQSGVCPHVEFRTGDGGAFTGDMHVAAVEGPASDGRQYLCAIVDQTERLAEHRELARSHAELAESRARLSAVIDASLDAIIGLDAERRIVLFNPAAAGLFGCSAAVALRAPPARFIPRVDELLSGLTQPEWHATTYEGGALTVEIAAAHDPRGAATTLFVRDLSPRKRAQKQQAMLEMQLLESQKMQAVGTLAGGIAHDFNNMLGAILGNLDLAKQDTKADDPAWVSLVEIEKASLRARDLVHQILAFSRKETSKKDLIDLRVVLDETIGLARVALPPRVELSIAAPPKLRPVMASPTQVQRALLNLCTNAVHAVMSSPRAGGQIRIEASVETPDVMLSSRLGLATEPHVVLRVRDDGIGMSDEVRKRAAEPFFTTKPVGQGTGLGLAVVHTVMRAHGGGVLIESEPDAGSVCSLYFPCSNGEATHDATPTTPGRTPGRGGHIIYVDDDTALLFLVDRMLTRRGYRVTGFSDAAVAIEALRERPNDFDLLITDYNMPGMSGLDVVRIARGLRNDLPLVLSSGYMTTELEARATADGVDAILHKPNQVDELCDVVERLVERFSRRTTERASSPPGEGRPRDL